MNVRIVKAGGWLLLGNLELATAVGKKD